jgi:hypothetical protein
VIGRDVLGERSRFEPISEDKWGHIYTVSGAVFGSTDPFGSKLIHTFLANRKIRLDGSFVV